ncbi:hypothetical protein ACFV0B_26900 [Streptomyces xanthophaeus]|uniref:hypothetical protein n=1 Tax=Streptomyces xanthophaeus TaxID=67385 RepID=UPI003688C07A
MITVSSMDHPTKLPARRAGTVRIASLDVEWTDKLVKGGNRPFCHSVVWIDLPTERSTDLADARWEFTSLYVEDDDEQDALVAAGSAVLRLASDQADLITGHQLSSDLAVLANKAPQDAELQLARARWKARRNPETAVRYVDTRYDASDLLQGHSRRLVDVCTELGLDVTQPELLRQSMPKLHRSWIGEGNTEARERVSVLNLRHSLSTAYVAARVEGLGHWAPEGFNVNQALSAGAKGAWEWLEQPTFTNLLEDPCPSATPPSSASKAARPPAKRR